MPIHNPVTDVADLLARLQARCDEEVDAIMQMISEKSNEIAFKILPLYEKKTHLEEDGEFIEAQIKVLDQYLIDPSSWTETSLNAKLQDAIGDIVAKAITKHGVHIAEREYTIRNGQLVEIKSKEAKAEEQQYFRQQYIVHAQQVYGAYKFDIKSNFKDLKETLHQSLICHEQEHEKTLKEYTDVLSALQIEQFRLEQKMYNIRAAFKAQKDNFAQYTPTPIEVLCLQGNDERLQQELKKFGNPKDYLLQVAPNALHYACWLGTYKTIATLVQAGVDINKPDTIPNMPTHYYPIHYLAMREDESDPVNWRDSVVSQGLTLLYEACANITASEARYGRTALHSAAWFGNRAAVSWFMEAMTYLTEADAKAFINQKERGRFQQNTALHHAATEGHWDIVEQLLSQGADCTVLNSSDHTALMALLCGDASTESKCHGMALFWRHGHALTQENIDKLKICSRPPYPYRDEEGIIQTYYDEKLRPVLETMRDMGYSFMLGLDLECAPKPEEQDVMPPPMEQNFFRSAAPVAASPAPQTLPQQPTPTKSRCTLM